MGACTSSPSQANGAITSAPSTNFLQQTTGKFRAAIEKGDAKRRVAVHASKLPNKFNKETECCERLLPTDGGPPAPKAKVDPAVVAKAVEGIALFQGINPDDSSVLFDSMYEFEFAPGEHIMKKGEEGRNLYVVVHGNPVVSVAGKEGQSTVERQLNPGDLFGEVALLADCPRTASVRAGDSKVVCWALGRTTFRQVLSDSAFKRRARFGELLNKVQLLSGLSDYARLQLADAVVATGYRRGQQILTQGKSDGVRFHIIERGQVQVVVSGQDSTKTLGPGDFFGELCLLDDGQAPTATIVALGEVAGPIVATPGSNGRCSMWVEPGSDVITISLDKDGFKRMLGDETVTRIIQKALKGYVFSAEDRHKSGARIVAKEKDKPKPPLPKESSQELKGDGVTGKLGRMMRRMSMTGPPARLQLEGVTLQDVTLLKKIGSGMTAFAYVSKVKTKQHGNIVAVSKVMNKYNLCRLGQVENVLREKQLLKDFDSPFVVHSVATFQDKTNLYLLMEYMVGGDMFQLLQVWGHISLAPCRFYAAEVLLALEYIHDRGYVYRDLKPENILIADSGHAKIADLGFCKKVANGDRTYTTCGTPDYMAPEVMLCQGYNKSADYWAFGVLVYEMLTGYAPFASDSDRDRHNRILRATISYPESFPAQGKDLVSRLCVLDISRRLGMMAGGIAEIQSHAFFSELKWSDVRTMNVKPPWTPRIRTLAELEKDHATLPQNVKVLQKEDQALFDGY